MNAPRRSRNLAAWRIAIVAAVLAVTALLGPPLSARQWLGAVAVLAVAGGLTALVARRRPGGDQP